MADVGWDVDYISSETIALGKELVSLPHVTGKRKMVDRGYGEAMVTSMFHVTPADAERPGIGILVRDVEADVVCSGDINADVKCSALILVRDKVFYVAADGASSGDISADAGTTQTLKLMLSVQVN
ncbi:Cytoplasmic Aconitate Hydratase [Manis pentadactyla]|nr:Cytoplasmic Aconitate Hydratase [Manis pentadactyla]